MIAPHILIPCRARVPSLSEITDYLEGHGWTHMPPHGLGLWDCWAGGPDPVELEVPRAELADWPRRALEVIEGIALVEGRAIEDVARDMDLFEVLP